MFYFFCYFFLIFSNFFPIYVPQFLLVPIQCSARFLPQFDPRSLTPLCGGLKFWGQVISEKREGEDEGEGGGECVFGGKSEMFGCRNGVLSGSTERGQGRESWKKGVRVDEHLYSSFIFFAECAAQTRVHISHTQKKTINFSGFYKQKNRLHSAKNWIIIYHNGVLNIEKNR